MGQDHTTTAVIVSDKSEKLPVRKDPVYKQFIREIGGRTGLRSIALASSNPKAIELLALLDDESYKTWGVKKLLQRADISFSEAIQLRDERSRNLAVSNLIAKLPDLADDLSKDAATRRIPCPICDAARVMAVFKKGSTETQMVVCWGCKGFGELVETGDKDARNIIAKATKLIDDKPGIMVDARTQVNSVTNQFGSSFEEVMKKAGKIIQAKKVEPSEN